MANPSPYPATGGDTGTEPGGGSTTGTPRWVKVFGIISLILILLFVFLHFTVGGFGGHKRPSGVTERGVQQP